MAVLPLTVVSLQARGKRSSWLSIDFPGKDIADPADRLNEPGILRIVFDLLAQPSDLCVDRPVECFPRSSAREIHQRLSTEDTPGLFDQCCKQIELSRGERDLA